MTLNRDRLRFFSPFSTLSGDYLDKVLDKAKVLDVPKGKIIFPRGKTLPDSLYLLEGEVDLVSASFERSTRSAGSEASQVPLNNTLPTELSAVATTPVRLLQLERDFIDKVMAWSQSQDQPQNATGTVEDENDRSEEHTSELQSRGHLVCRLLLEKKKKKRINTQQKQEST